MAKNSFQKIKTHRTFHNSLLVECVQLKKKIYFFHFLFRIYFNPLARLNIVSQTRTRWSVCIPHIYPVMTVVARPTLVTCTSKTFTASQVQPSHISLSLSLSLLLHNSQVQPSHIYLSLFLSVASQLNTHPG